MRKTMDRSNFIGGSDARIVMGKDEKALLRLWREKRLKHRSAETVTWRFKPSG